MIGWKILQRRALYDSLWFLTRASSAAKKGTHQKLSRHKWKKPENLTFIGIVTDAVERNPRENAETIPANRPIDLFIASADLLSRWSFSQFPLSHRKRKKKVRPIFVLIGEIFGERSENVRIRARGLFRFGKSKMADIADKTNFDELCTKCEQMELDVSKIDLTWETNVFASFFCDAHAMLFCAGTEISWQSQFQNKTCLS